MRRTYTPRVRWISGAAALILILMFILPIFPVSRSAEADSASSAVPDVTIPQESEPETVPETVYEPVQFPAEPTYPDPESLQTIYDVEAALCCCSNFLAQLDELRMEPTTEHPQIGEWILLKERAEQQRAIYAQLLEDHWNTRQAAYPNMTEIWLYLTNDAYLSDAVSAGIIGNMCVEAGGNGTGDIQPHIWDGATGKTYYGVCQWNVKFYPDVKNKDLRSQLNFLVNTYKQEFENYGSNYSNRYGSKFRTEQFLAMDDPYEAAIAFAMCYERCGKNHVKIRGSIANNVFEYYTQLNSSF